jgi:hypothetical protein
MAISNQIQGATAGQTPNGDPRWQVVERIIASPSFQKSERLEASRDVNTRQIQDENYVLLGSSYSYPWVELDESRLNFVM